MVLGFGHHSQRDPAAATEQRGRDPFIATGRGGAGNVSNTELLFLQPDGRAALSTAQAATPCRSGRAASFEMSSKAASFHPQSGETIADPAFSLTPPFLFDFICFCSLCIATTDHPLALPFARPLRQCYPRSQRRSCCSRSHDLQRSWWSRKRSLPLP